MIIEGSLEVNFPTIWTDEKQRWSRRIEKRREEKKREDQRRSEKRKKDVADAQKGRKVAKHCVFPMIWGSEGSKSRLAKAAGAEPSGQMRDEKMHAVVARSTFRSQKVKTTTCSDHFWKLRCRKSARRCSEKHMSKSKCTKHTMFGPLLEVEMSKKCTPLWREAHFEVKNVQSTSASEHFWTLLEIEMLEKCMLLWREAHVEVKRAKNSRVRSTFGRSDVLFAWQAERIVHLVSQK